MRINVLIVDDNPAVLEGLAHSVDWNGLGCTLFTASGASEALILFTECEADIVLSDICMPGIDGLEMASLLLKRKKELQIIFFTGFEELDYARKAIHLGASDFILKPIDEAELTNAIEKASIRIHDGKRTEERLNRLQQGHIKTLMIELISSQWQTDDLWFNSMQKEIQLYPSHVQCIRIESLNGPLKMDSSFEQSWHTGEPENGIMIYPLYDANGITITILFSQNTSPNKEMKVRHVISKFRVYLNKQEERSIFFGIGPLLEIANGAGYETSTQAAEAAETLRFFMSPQVHGNQYQISELLASEAGLDEANIIPALSRMVEDFNKDLEHKPEAAKEILNKIEHLLNGVRVRPSLIKMILKDALLHLHRKVSRVPSSDTLLPDPVPLFKAIDQARNLKQCLETIHNFYDHCMALGKRVFNERYSTPVRFALSKLQNSHANSIGLEELAASCGLSPGHLSRLLKKETGSTFTELLHHIRIGEAVRYLCSSNLKVYEIAEKVGFENPAYFYQIFKRVTGVSPKDYVRKADKMIDFFTFPSSQSPG